MILVPTGTEYSSHGSTKIVMCMDFLSHDPRLGIMFPASDSILRLLVLSWVLGHFILKYVD